ncbi:MAG TPA: carboxypeptidase-like regulatory domain-containing protein [Thermoplasmata archaeon]
MTGWTGICTAALVAGLLLGGTAGVALLQPASAALPSAVALYQSPGNITEQGTLSVHLQVTDSTDIQQVYFTFCQLTSSECYLPVVMAPQGGNWFVGTTNPMTAYPDMKVGVRAGYNITILLNDNSTVYEPNLPNQFGNLTLAQSVTGEYMFAMTVSDHVYALSGTVTSVATGAGVAGVNVTLTPGPSRVTTTDSVGTYTFDAVANGTYTVSVAGAGYLGSNVTVAIAGQDVVRDVQLSHDAIPPDNGGSPSNGGLGILTTPLGLGALATVVALVALLGLVAYSRSTKKKGGRKPSAGVRAETTPPSSPGPE